MSVLVWIAVAGLGGTGAIARFLLDAAVSSRAGRGFPFGTFAVNLSGTFILGLLVGMTLEGDAYLLAGTATLGSYTTFSTWMFESHRPLFKCWTGRCQTCDQPVEIDLLLLCPARHDE